MNELLNKKQFVQLGIVLFIIFYYYLWTAIPESNNFNPRNNIFNYYNKLADSFLSGQLHLKQKPQPELLEFQNPYDPEVDRKYKLWDASLYKGKYYVYFGPAPVLTLYIPFKLFFGKGLSDYLAVLIFMFGGVLWGTFILLLLRKKYFKSSPFWILLLTVAVLGFSNVAPFNLRRLAQYQVAIASGYFFVLGGLFFLCYAFQNEKKRLFLLASASLFFGMAAGSRPTATFTMFSLILVWLKLCKEDKQKIRANTVAIVVPFILCLFIWGLYNYLRFDNFFENGFRHQLTWIDQRKLKPLGIHNLIPSTYLYIFHQPEINKDFPFIHAYSTCPKISFPRLYYFEKIVGIFPSVPFVLFLLICPLILLLQKSNRNVNKVNSNPRFPRSEFLIIFLPGLLILIVYLFWFAALMRYVADFISLIVLSSGIVFMYVDSVIQKSSFDWVILRIFILIFATISIVFGAAFGIEGCEMDQSLYGLKGYRPAEFKRLERIFQPVSKIIKLIKTD